MCASCPHLGPAAQRVDIGPAIAVSTFANALKLDEFEPSGFVNASEKWTCRLSSDKDWVLFIRTGSGTTIYAIPSQEALEAGQVSTVWVDLGPSMFSPQSSDSRDLAYVRFIIGMLIGDDPEPNFEVFLRSLPNTSHSKTTDSLSTRSRVELSADVSLPRRPWYSSISRAVGRLVGKRRSH